MDHQHQHPKVDDSTDHYFSTQIFLFYLYINANVQSTYAGTTTTFPLIGVFPTDQRQFLFSTIRPCRVDT